MELPRGFFSTQSVLVVDDIDAIRSAVKGMLQMLGCKGISIQGNQVKLEQVFVNLLNNAKDAIVGNKSSEGGMIKISSRQKRAMIIIDITDNGEGMSHEVKENIFNAFFSTKDVGKGTGVGLSISHSIVSEFKGTISCESECGKGTTFTLTFPKEEKREKEV